jgi:hypothetical protein
MIITTNKTNAGKARYKEISVSDNGKTETIYATGRDIHLNKASEYTFSTKPGNSANTLCIEYANRAGKAKAIPIMTRHILSDTELFI